MLEAIEHTYLPSAVAPDVIAQNQRSTIDKLRSLRMASASGMAASAGEIYDQSTPPSPACEPSDNC